MRRKNLFFIFLFLFSLVSCNQKRPDSTGDILTLLLLNAFLNASNGPCVAKESLNVTSIGTWDVGLGVPVNYSQVYPFSLHRTQPMVQFFLDQDPSVPHYLFPVNYTNRFDYGSAFFNRDLLSYVPVGSSTSMLPYGKDTFYATDPAVSILNTASSSQNLGVDFNFVNSIPTTATIIKSCRELETDELTFQTTDATSSSSGLSHVWQTEKNLDVNIIFVNDGSNLSYPIQSEAGLALALNKWRQNYSQNTVRIKLNFNFSTLNSSNFFSISNLSTAGNSPGSLGGLFSTTANVGKSNALNLFVVSEELQYGGVLGVSGGIPGPATILGTRQSGMVVFIETHRMISNTGDPFTSDEQLLLGETMSHEAGHFLGLWHLIESGGDTGAVGDKDPLRDTPACSALNDADTSGTMSIGECLGTGSTNSGARNMMFWTGTVGFTQGEITAEQGWILRLNPLVY
ncbi:M43 family zinc metalloprotease [Leptospira sp. 96542]|nr:M43 family zinc metalloprotease [Leptospira sp. 96542]